MATKHAFGKERFELMDWILIIILPSERSQF